ncbi:MAG: hypothetical protein DMG85_07890 [Acidobacteria bacterium]|nr:MAG: hypothetical protein DMG85_07890 [Acidobacteriota bacterium]
MRPIDERLTDFNGRKFRRYTVRKIGNGYSPFDKLRGVIIANADRHGWTREQAWEYMRTH